MMDRSGNHVCVDVCIFVAVRTLLQGTALYMASQNGKPEVVTLLLKNGADVNVMCNKVCASHN